MTYHWYAPQYLKLASIKTPYEVSELHRQDPSVVRPSGRHTKMLLQRPKDT